ncbi:RarD protein [Saprolegnia parasitica CBS 223.65]|uniref:RarD protein n=1 Tax=Saprolegnia parasitica (strain CBS 223.65) TaxID=695850 RepID=A0A067CCX2_SAPPC|nr:RarD protein [Saprolegnia parasitica CBS 223.65]KDO28604.1 RarD protein [Saprolegnia parasitica CBS 223.65]|eukprot:XP_012200667.1 RarD protein [Saprolegnia parasitica CBS 223.65]
MQPGVVYALSAFITWGLYPLYWKQLTSVPDIQLAMHRIAWSFVLLAIILSVKQQWIAFKRGISSWKVLGTYALSSVFIFTNWYILVWAINAGYIVETSLGLFINPLINVLFGVVIFKETLSKWQWAAIGLAFSGVVVVAVAYGKFPWVAFTTAITFALYGLIKKQAPLNPLHGMMLETSILFPIAVMYLVYAESQGIGAFLHVSVGRNALLIGGGVVTVVPLLLFSAAAQLIPLSLLGILQYIAPSLQFLLGTLVYDEPLSMFKLVGFILVWTALALYTAEGFLCHQTPKEVIVAVPTPTGSDESSVVFEQV